MHTLNIRKLLSEDPAKMPRENLCPKFFRWFPPRMKRGEEPWNISGFPRRNAGTRGGRGKRKKWQGICVRLVDNSSSINGNKTADWSLLMRLFIYGLRYVCTRWPPAAVIHSHKTKIETFFGDGPKDEPRVFLWQLKDPTRGHRLVGFFWHKTSLSYATCLPPQWGPIARKMWKKIWGA